MEVKEPSVSSPAELAAITPLRSRDYPPRSGDHLHQLLSHRAQILQAAVHALQGRIGIALLLDNIPLRAAGILADVKDGLPIDLALPDERLVVGGRILFQMD